MDGPPIRKDLRKWIPMAAATGVLAGLCAAAFYWLLHVCTRFVLGSLTGYRPATVAADGAFHQAVRPTVGWAVPLVVAGGAFVGTALVLFFAPEAAGHGSDDAIRAAHEEPGRPRVKVGVVKLLASAITIGSGGSGGSEGPIAQISAAFAPLVSRLFRLPDRRAKQVLAIGMGAGIGAIFRTPLAGALLGAELLYVADFEAAVIVPGLIASTVAFGVFGLINGFDPFLGRVAPYHWPGLLQFLVFPAIGLVCGVLGRVYLSTYHGITAWFARGRVIRRLPRLLRPVVAGLTVGGLGLIVPGVLGTGYGSMQAALDTHTVQRMSVGILIAIPLAKILATSLSIGSGGSGGIFGPGLVVGAATGALIWRVVEPLGLAPASPAPFVIAGMAACLGPIVHAPVALVVLATEATGNASMLMPTMVAVGIASFVVGNRTLYRSQLPTVADAPFLASTVDSAARRPPSMATTSATATNEGGP